MVVLDVSIVNVALSRMVTTCTSAFPAPSGSSTPTCLPSPTSCNLERPRRFWSSTRLHDGLGSFHDREYRRRLRFLPCLASSRAPHSVGRYGKDGWATRLARRRGHGHARFPLVSMIQVGSSYWPRTRPAFRCAFAKVQLFSPLATPPPRVNCADADSRRVLNTHAK